MRGSTDPERDESGVVALWNSRTVELYEMRTDNLQSCDQTTKQSRYKTRIGGEFFCTIDFSKANETLLT